MFGFFFRVAADDKTVGHHADLSPIGIGLFFHIRDNLFAVFQGIDLDKIKVHFTCGEVLAGGRETGVNQSRIGLLDRLGQQIAVFDLEELARVIKILLGPQALNDLEPLAGVPVALVVFHLLGRKHFHLRREPAAHNVQAPAPMGDMVNRCALLGGHNGMNGGDVRGGEEHNIFGLGGHGRGPGIGLHAGPIKIGAPAKALPASNGHQEFESQVIGLLGNQNAMFIGGLKGGLGMGDGTPIATVLTKNTQLHFVVIKDGDVLAAMFLDVVWMHEGSFSGS